MFYPQKPEENKEVFIKMKPLGAFQELDVVLTPTPEQIKFFDLSMECSAYIYNFFWEKRLAVFKAYPKVFFAMAPKYPLFASQYFGPTMAEIRSRTAIFDKISFQAMTYAESLQWLDFTSFFYDKKFYNHDYDEDILHNKRIHLDFFSEGEDAKFSFAHQYIRLPKLGSPVSFRRTRLQEDLLGAKIQKITIWKAGDLYQAKIFFNRRIAGMTRKFMERDFPFDINRGEGRWRGRDNLLSNYLLANSITRHMINLS